MVSLNFEPQNLFGLYSWKSLCQGDVPAQDGRPQCAWDLDQASLYAKEVALF